MPPFSAPIRLAATPDSAYLTASFINAESGDCTLIGCGNKVVLVDAGIDGNIVHSYLSKYWNESQQTAPLEVLAIATHPHADHISGFGKVLADSSRTGSHYSISSFYMRNVERPEEWDLAAYNKLTSELAEGGFTPTEPTDGKIVSWGKMSVTMFFEEGFSGNNPRIVTKVKFGSTSILITADAEGRLSLPC